MFIEYVNLRVLQFQKLEKLDVQDLKSLNEIIENKSFEKVLKLFVKAGIDVEGYSQRIGNLTQKIEEKYNLSLLENRNDVIVQAVKKTAALQNAGPNCALVWASALAICQAMYPDWGDGYLECLIWADSLYLSCIVIE